MEDILVGFETARLAKEKGFNIPTLYGCNERGELQEYITYASYAPGEPEIRIEDFINTWEYQLPTQSLLQRWLREVHDILVYVYPKSHHYFEYHIIRDDDHIISSVRSNNWEEILELGLQVGLKLTKNRR